MVFINEISLIAYGNSVGGASSVESPEQACPVRFSRALGQVQDTSDLFGGISFCGEVQDFQVSVVDLSTHGYLGFGVKGLLWISWILSFRFPIIEHEKGTVFALFKFEVDPFLLVE